MEFRELSRNPLFCNLVGFCFCLFVCFLVQKKKWAQSDPHLGKENDWFGCFVVRGTKHLFAVYVFVLFFYTAWSYISTHLSSPESRIERKRWRWLTNKQQHGRGSLNDSEVWRNSIVRLITGMGHALQWHPALKKNHAILSFFFSSRWYTVSLFPKYLSNKWYT